MTEKLDNIESDISDAYEHMLQHVAIARAVVIAAREENMPELLQAKAAAICLASALISIERKMLRLSQELEMVDLRPIDLKAPITKRAV